jgi:hypothetical protein
MRTIDKLDFTMTAVRRPELVYQTLASFQQGLHGVDMRRQTLYLNIDPVPTDIPVSKVILVAHEFFQQVVLRTPDKPSFPAAVKWCWGQPKSEFFFHLEDDWLLTGGPINMLTILALLQQDLQLSCVNLRAYDGIQDARICLSPGIHRTAHAKVMASRLSLDANPEKQLRPSTPQCPQGGKHEGFWGRQVPRLPVVKDIGRAWLAQSGFQKERDIWWTTWEAKGIVAK